MKLSLDQIRDCIEKALIDARFNVENDAVKLPEHCRISFDVHIENNKVSKTEVDYRYWSKSVEYK